MATTTIDHHDTINRPPTIDKKADIWYVTPKGEPAKVSGWITRVDPLLDEQNTHYWKVSVHGSEYEMIRFTTQPASELVAEDSGNHHSLGIVTSVEVSETSQFDST